MHTDLDYNRPRIDAPQPISSINVFCILYNANAQSMPMPWAWPWDVKSRYFLHKLYQTTPYAIAYIRTQTFSTLLFTSSQNTAFHVKERHKMFTPNLSITLHGITRLSLSRFACEYARSKPNATDKCILIYLFPSHKEKGTRIHDLLLYIN